MLNQMMDNFMVTYRVKNTPVTADSMKGTIQLMLDEVNETVEEVIDTEGKPLETINVPALAKEMADVIYVTAQRMRRMGFDVDAILTETHRSNMTKTVALADAKAELDIARERYPSASIVEGTRDAVLRCTDTGKVIKPTCYTPANITKEMI